ncbi:cobalt ABC transporter ATP-binding protein [Mycobacterium paraffinicum]|uniref:Cobalt ABC transporter ATP-binding protein n=1 Tax=Mycobacterium paraffinicum TaxID=53378 RepID=A0A1Q4H8P3_9MYCO|nr:cobalt ABC transporter ATP-binding protein [Mycobacterium paraffinicum]
MAQASVMGALCAVIAIIAGVIPFAQGLALLGTVPMGLLSYRYRLRVLLAATFAAGMIAFLISGVGGFVTVVNCAYIGGLTGLVKRRGRGTPTVIVSSLIVGLVVAAVTVGALAVLNRLRHLIFEVMSANVDGVVAFLGRVNLRWLGADVKRCFEFGLHYWPWLMLGYVTYGVVVSSWIGWWALSRLLDRMGSVPDVHKLDAPDEPPGAAIGPVPVRLDRVRFRYPHAKQDALRELSLELQVGEHVAVIGANGSGKTTLTLILAGRLPTSGTVQRPGAVGLGMLGGTALVLQHPKSQVLGTRVADDVVWGLPPGTEVDVDHLLQEVGLGGFAERDTGGLSGGELQRLALAAALAREPALLIADEFTSMVDQRGRQVLLNVLSGLPKRHRTALVHITHFDNEAASADRTINLSDSPDNTGMVETAPAPLPATAVRRGPGKPVLEIVGVSHEYNSGTPWAKTALRDVNFVVEQGDGILIHGGNGSGKSTLAWIMAGLTVPTVGACLLDGEPIRDHIGAVALSFQTARLQLMRSHVGLEVASVAGFSPRDEGRVTAALAAVGLEPTMGKRRIDQLSGGQMRRVVLAGLLACSPRVLILDEPLAGLDVGSQRGLLRLLADLRRHSGLTVVVISHDFVGLEAVCPRTLHVQNGTLQAVSAAAAAGGVS